MPHPAPGEGAQTRSPGILRLVVNATLYCGLWGPLSLTRGKDKKVDRGFARCRYLQQPSQDMYAQPLAAHGQQQRQNPAYAAPPAQRHTAVVSIYCNVLVLECQPPMFSR